MQSATDATRGLRQMTPLILSDLPARREQTRIGRREEEGLLSDRNSNCSARVPVSIYWWACETNDPNSNRAEMLDALWRAIDAPNRRWNPFAKTLVKREFAKRIERAAAGKLAPVDEVKPLRHGSPPIFEIRWPGVPVTEMESDENLRYREVEIRLIHGEPVALGLAAVGLVAHEKQVFDGDPMGTRVDQDKWIDQALGHYDTGVKNHLLPRQSS